MTEAQEECHHQQPPSGSHSLPTQYQRLQGCLLGGALGDAVGLFTEYLPRSECLKIYGPSPSFTLLPLGGKGHPLCPPATAISTTASSSAGSNSYSQASVVPIHFDQHRSKFLLSGWTDDTDQTLLILFTWLRNGGNIPEQPEIQALTLSSSSNAAGNSNDGLDGVVEVSTDSGKEQFAQRLRIWMVEGLRVLDREPLGLGMTVGKVVGSQGYLKDPVGAAKRIWEDSGRNQAANGAVMRTCIIGALMFQDRPRPLSTLYSLPRSEEHNDVGDGHKERKNDGDNDNEDKNGSSNNQDEIEMEDGLFRTFRTAIDIASTTHADPRCLISCAIASGLVAALMRNSPPTSHPLPSLRTLLTLALTHFSTNHPSSPLPAEHLQELNHVCLEITALEELELDDMRKLGYTFKALGCGIWAVRRAMGLMDVSWDGMELPPIPIDSTAITAGNDLNASSPSIVPKREIFERLITEIIMQGGDADTNCSVAGPLLGSLLGVNNLPYHWTVGLGYGALEKEGEERGENLEEGGEAKKENHHHPHNYRDFLMDLSRKAGELLQLEMDPPRSSTSPPYDYANDPTTHLYGGPGNGPMSEKEREKLEGRVWERMLERLGGADGVAKNARENPSLVGGKRPGGKKEKKGFWSRLRVRGE